MNQSHQIVEGDPLTSGGQVVGGASHATIEGPDGVSRRQTHLGHEAWCEACKSFGVVAEGSGIPDHLRAWDERLQAKEAVDGDIVLCKCERPPQVIAQYGRLVEYRDFDGNAGVAPPAASSPVSHDEQFTLTDATGNALADTYYTVRLPSGELSHGVTDSSGRTDRYWTDGSCSINFYLGHRQEA